MYKNKPILYRLSLVIFVFGILLLLLNIYGFFHPLGNNDIYTEEHVLFIDDINKNAKNILEEVINENNIFDREEYIKKVVLAVNKNIAHYWWNEGRIKYNLTIPIYKNFILWFKQFTDSKHYKFYEFCNYSRALERKVGLCSQHAIIVCGILNEKKIPCKIVALSGHVVAMVEIAPTNKSWILDADYNVIIPFSIKEIEKEPSLIIPYYQNKMTYSDYALLQKRNMNKNSAVNAISLSRLVDIYGKKGNYIVNGVKRYCGNKYSFEEKSYYLKWIVPLLMMFPLGIIKFMEQK